MPQINQLGSKGWICLLIQDLYFLWTVCWDWGQRGREKNPVTEDNLEKLRNAPLRLLWWRNYIFVFWAIVPLDLFVRANRCQLSIQKRTQPLTYLSPKVWLHLWLCMLHPIPEVDPGEAENPGWRWKSQAHLFDLCLEVPQLKALFESLMSLLRIELQFMLLLMEKLQ